MRRILAVLLVLLLTSLGSVAYADSIYYPNPNATEPSSGDFGGDHWIAAPASSRFDACLSIVGRYNKKGELTDKQKAMLSNEGSGGDFYDLAQLLTSVEQSGKPSWAENWPITSAGTQMSLLVMYYGESHVWYGTITHEQVMAAQHAFDTIFGGGSIDPGDSGIDGQSLYWVGGTGRTLGDGRSVKNFVYNLIFDSELQERIDYYHEQYPYMIIPKSKYFNQSGSNVDSSGFMYGNNYIYLCKERASFPPDFTSFTITNGCVIITYKQNSFVASGSTFAVNLGYASSNVSNVATNTIGFVSNSSGNDYYLNTGKAPVEDPTNHWPEPTNPTPQPEPDPPDVPGPPDLPGPPENPTIDPPNPEPEPTGTSPVDYTPWLRAILNALNRLIGDLASHCLHIRSYMRTCANYLGGCFSHLEGYMHDLAEWLAEQLKWDVDIQGYDDAYLRNLLSQIYSRLGDLDSAVSDLSAQLGDIYVRLGDLDSAISDLSAQLGDIYVRLGQILAKIGSGGGRPTTEPEIDDGFDFWQWLLDLITNKLGDIITDFVGDIGGFLNELISKFPFSIPWDIMAYLALLDANRVTPVITFVIPAIDGWWPEQQLVIDLAPFDDAMAAVRSMMLIVWGFILVMKTDWLGKVFDDAVQVVVGFFDRLAGHGSGA